MVEGNAGSDDAIVEAGKRDELSLRLAMIPALVQMYLAGFSHLLGALEVLCKLANGGTDITSELFIGFGRFAVRSFDV